ncbi:MULTISPECIES: hypothetical protein [unclassified Photobacterium]|uniref:hypothetical protein n=1 Tax=unclassified Photobacterium TaxID=2628852 RepID=UPI000D162FD2|nr:MULTISPECIES: hypothetical protein [unclassified Photobacterium]PSV31186.1 hypothetical protein C9J40_09065 [Photobacterium sp. GB-72]PSV34057.1 hypothetical protein C9J38_18940 [Photobacterium sp. GB-210]PSV53641.1 hypothetical protein C9J45_06205 [Photobacterium sp. GB-1]
MKNLYVTLFTAALLFGCGGGGGDDGGSTSAASPEASPEASPAAPEVSDSVSGAAPVTVSKFEDLVIPDNYDLITTYDMPIKIDLNTSEPMSLSVYCDYNVADDGTLTPIASSRIISGQIENGDFNGVIAATSSVKSLLIEAWYQDTTKAPFQTVVNADVNGVTISN